MKPINELKIQNFFRKPETDRKKEEMDRKKEETNQQTPYWVTLYSTEAKLGKLRWVSVTFLKNQLTPFKNNDK